ncbi:MAG: DUF3696 domain-containing protein [Victivallales bacterium]|nr:DUF3696 domain-containing protein [Victivallales bacterium]
MGNFKCYNDTTIDFSNLTVFSGINGSGKSTAIQSVLLMKQILNDGKKKGDVVDLNGELIYLGTADDVQSKWMPEKTSTTMEFMDEQSSVKIMLGKDFKFSDIHKMRLEDIEYKNIIGDFRLLAYLSAERIGPRTAFDVPHTLPRLNPYGNKGENTAAIIVHHEGEKLPKGDFLKRFSEDGSSNTLLGQLQNCYALLGKEIRIRPIYHEDAEKIALEYSVCTKYRTWNSFRPLNVGFGLTYTLPIFTSLLLANAGDMVIVENPEAHLHPKGQVVMGRFLAWAASAGVQVIIETHSDHVINGIRLAVKKEEAKPEQVKLNYVGNDDSEEGAQIVSPNILPDGRIDIWPEGFFDEYDNTLAELF